MSPPLGLPLWLRRRADKYWYEYLADSKALYVQNAWNDYVDGRDPAMEAILQYTTRQSIANVLKTAIQKNGLEYAITYVKTLESNQ